MIRDALICALAILALAGCKKAEPEPVIPADIAVNKIATVDGCDVYRIQDGGSWSHFARCPHVDPAAVSEKQYCGKACWRDVETPTEDKP